MSLFNAQIVNSVNANTANAVLHDAWMGKRTESEPSDFWRRLTEAWSRHGLPTSQNGVATKLGMSQGSTRRWYTGEGMPELDKLKGIAEKGKVTVDWLLNGTLPKHPIRPNTPLGRLHEIWDKLDDAAHQHILQAAEGQLAINSRRMANSNHDGDNKTNQRRAAG